jgi:hypothetical protein
MLFQPKIMPVKPLDSGYKFLLTKEKRIYIGWGGVD